MPCQPSGSCNRTAISRRPDKSSYISADKTWFWILGETLPVIMYNTSSGATLKGKLRDSSIDIDSVFRKAKNVTICGICKVGDPYPEKFTPTPARSRPMEGDYRPTLRDSATE